MENYRRLFRPTMGWVCIPLIAYGFVNLDVPLDRLIALLGFAGGLFAMRGVEKINGKE